MRVRILACIQAAVLVLSSFQTMAGTISNDNQVLVIETETETKTEEELFSETEAFYDMTEGDCGEAGNEAEDETLSETENETKTEDETKTETDEYHESYSEED